jgi:hypothetical protein
MAYQVSRSGNKGKWRVIFEAPGVRRNVPVNSPEARSAGFYPNMSFEEARAQQTRLKALGAVERETRVRERARLDALKETAFLSKFDAAGFEEVMARQRIQQTHWKTMQKLIVEMPHPSKWAEATLYKLLAQKRYSPTYAKKLRHYLNHWGEFICQREGRFFKKLGRPTAAESRALRLNVKRQSGKSVPLTPETLKTLSGKIPPEQFRWLSLSVWFGLRPREVDNLAKENRELWELTGEHLAVFQEKLLERGVEEEKCWKLIPLRFPEQVEASKLIGQPIERPSNYLLKSLVRGLTCYGGRKGFVELLRYKGVDIIGQRDAMGHQSVTTLEAFYEPRRQLRRR